MRTVAWVFCLCVLVTSEGVRVGQVVEQQERIRERYSHQTSEDRVSNNVIKVMWEAFKAQFEKSYTSVQEEERYAIFTENYITVEMHNRKFHEGKETYKMGLNQFTDLRPEEVSAQYGGGLMTVDIPENPQNVNDVVEDLPDTVDWREQGAVTSVKNELQCGACWAFSVVGALEGQWFLKKKGEKQAVSLSAQDLMDCSSSAGNHGCEGGFIDKTFDFIKQRGGIDTEASYPYTGQNSNVCRYNTSNVGATATGYVDVPKGDEEALKKVLATVGPVANAVDATHTGFQMYRSGVYKDSTCSSTALDHSMLIVGYGVEKGEPYWLCKNMWGTTWGDKGYIKIARNSNNMCGVASLASYPLV